MASPICSVPHLRVLICEHLRIFDPLLDLFLSETALVVGDGDLLALTGALVLGAGFQDTVGVELESLLDLRLSVIGRSPSKTWMLTAGWLSW